MDPGQVHVPELTDEIAHMMKLSANAESFIEEPYRSSVKVVGGPQPPRVLGPNRNMTFGGSTRGARHHLVAGKALRNLEFGALAFRDSVSHREPF
jgi:hypothetical protein